MGFVSSEDSDQPRHPPSLIRVFTVSMKLAMVHSYTYVELLSTVDSNGIYEPRPERTCICICKNKGADQLGGNCPADQRLCFCYIDSTISLLLKSEISSL